MAFCIAAPLKRHTETVPQAQGYWAARSILLLALEVENQIPPMQVRIPLELNS